MDDKMVPDPHRRAVMALTSLLPLAAAVAPPVLAQTPDADDARRGWRFFTTHEAAVVDAATRRIVPGPTDDPLEFGHPGAAECGVVRYIDTVLGMFSFDTPRLYAGGPWSNRPAGGPNFMASFTPPDRVKEKAWRKRVEGLQADYRAGVRLLDAQSGGDFSAIPRLRQDQVLAAEAVAAFTALLFQHTIEGMYSNPEYGGNRDLKGWREIGWPGDSQPVGYSAAQMSAREFSVLEPTGITAMVLGLFAGATSESTPQRAREADKLKRSLGTRSRHA